MINNLSEWESVDGLAFALSLEGRQFVRNGNLQDAEKQLRRAIAIDSYCLGAYDLLEYVLDVQGRFDESTEVHEQRRRAVFDLLYS